MFALDIGLGDAITEKMLIEKYSDANEFDTGDFVINYTMNDFYIDKNCDEKITLITEKERD